MGDSNLHPGDARKTRGDSTLDGLRPDLAEEFFAYVESHTLAQAQELLAGDPRYRIALSQQAISVWAAKRRKEASEIRFRAWLGTLAQNSARAREVVREVTGAEAGTALDGVEHIEQGNVAVLNALLLQALQSKDIADITLYAKLSAIVGETRAKQRSASAALLSAETASKRFYFDAAKLALEHAAELQAINTSSGSQREKIERAVVRLFGTRPAMSKTDVNEDNDGQAEKTPFIDIENSTLDKGVSDV